MDPGVAADMLARALFLVVRVVAVLIIPGLVVGLLISILQAATQVTEQTLSFLPKLLLTLATMALAANWLIQELSDLFIMFYSTIPNLL